VTRAGGPAAAARSLRLAVLAVAAGVALVLLAAGRPWAQVAGSVTVQGLGSAQVARVGVSGNDVAPLSGVAMLAAVVALGVAFTRGRGRWPVGAALVGLGAWLLWLIVVRAGRLREAALELASLGRLEGLPAGARLEVGVAPLWPALAGAGAVLVAAAGAEALRRGRRWPALGAAFRAPGDRPPAPAAGTEPPWEGD
jgi:hypothetical protein